MRTLEPTPLDGSGAPAQTNVATKAAPPKASPTSGKRPWERFGPLTLDFRPLTVNGLELEVSRIPAFAVSNGTLVFPPFSAIDQIEYAASHGLALPTAEVMDAIHKASWWHAPITSGYDPNGDMQSDSVVLDHGRKWQLAFENGYDGNQFVSNTMKAWIVDPIGIANPGMGVNRGYWMTKDAKEPTQKRGIAHTATYRDVAQGAWYVRNTAAYIPAIESGKLGNAPFSYQAAIDAARKGALAGVTEDAVSALSTFVGMLEGFFRRFIPSGGESIQVRAWNGNEYWTDRDIRRLVEIADNHGLNPADILLIHLSETGGGDPKKWHTPIPGQTASGMMQWIRTTSTSLGVDHDSIMSMDIAGQLEVLNKYVGRYFDGKGVRDAADMYMINYIGFLCKTDSCSPKPGSAAYDLNKALDKDGDSDIDLVDLRRQLNDSKKRVWDTKPMRTVR